VESGSNVFCGAVEPRFVTVQSDDEITSFSVSRSEEKADSTGSACEGYDSGTLI